MCLCVSLLVVHYMWHSGLLRYNTFIKTRTGGNECIPVVSISSVLCCFWLYFRHKSRSALTAHENSTHCYKKQCWPHGISAHNGEYRSVHSECYIKCNYTWYFRMCCTDKMSMDRVYREQAHYRESKGKTGSLRLVKTFHIQTVDILVAGWDAPVRRRSWAGSSW